jgi:Holliday junction resolvase RusA-like endonuclease
LKVSISIGWQAALSKNQAYNMGDPKLGHTPSCEKAMLDIVLLLRPAIGYGWKWNGERIKVKINVYRPRKNVDAQNFVDSVSDAVEEAIHVDDSNFNVVPLAIDDYEGEPRIEIELTQEVSNG